MARTPLHARIAADLRGRIHDRELTPGDLLPSESALQEQFSVSRSVVRQALGTLEVEGLVRRAQGRGTIVAPRSELRRDVDLTSGLMSQLESLGSRTTTAVLRFEATSPPQHVDALGDEVVVLERLRSVDDQVVAFIRTYLPADVGAAIDPAGLVDGSLHATVHAATGRRVVDGRRTVRAVAAAPPLDATLGVATGAPLLLLEGRSLDQDGRPIEEFSTWHRSDLVAFDLALHPHTETVVDGTGPSVPTAARLERAATLAEELAAELRSVRDA